ncbi:BgTH12-04588 [Blumeria graminis f. sp. triticale]|uniref:BgTH12-04588 n=1 Tax=Blumeria graminis f. sp. triticale TaxID=1689686 RepID=A0A9W4CZ15_BLUGR|nr:BgTH12-04588 [Blumeria graminis f. sp. triticale]
MGGDLNLKKSWHPVLMSNQKRVWEEEKKALDERKRTEQRIKELKEERAKEEIQTKLEAAGSRKRIDRVDWMYQGPSTGQTGTTEEMEGYLLGKRRIDGLIKGNDNRNLEKRASQESYMNSNPANTARDTATKVREDPLLAIKRQEQAAYETMINDPTKRRQLLALAGQAEENYKERFASEKRSERHSHPKNTYNEDYQKGTRHRRRDDHSGHRNTQDYYSSDKQRRVSQNKDQDTKKTHHTTKHVRNSHSRTYDSRSHDPHKNYRRSTSPDNSYRPRSSVKTENSVKRKRSPNDGQDSLRGRDSQANQYGRRNYQDNREKYRQSNNQKIKRGKSEERPTSPRSTIDGEAQRRQKLAQMQQDASKLDADREKRLSALAEQEKTQRDVEEKARARTSRYGDKGDFVNGLNQKANSMSLAERIGRSRRGLLREDD